MSASPDSTTLQQMRGGLLLVVDGHAFAYRAYHAIRQLTGPDGRATNAIFGFIKMVAKLREKLCPTHVVVVWDGGLAAGRTAAVPDYKSNRPEMPDDLRYQLDEMVEYLAAAGLASLKADGVEADDWIAGLTRHAAQSDVFVVIASSDKDFFQLIGDRVAMWNPNDKSEVLWNAAKVEAKTGVPPHNIVDWLSLTGDAVDNIKGVPGVGPKTAAELLREFGSIDGIYGRLAEVRSDKLRANLLSCRDIVERNRKVVALWPDEGCLPPLEELRVGGPNWRKLADLYQRWGFRSMRAETEKHLRTEELELFC